MSGLDVLLSRLDRVRTSGKGWTACCPAHADRSASLSIGETGTGKVLIHCFAGCAPLEIVQAIGLSLTDLFPERLAASTPEERRAAKQAVREANWEAAHGVLSREATIVLIAAKAVSLGHALEPDAVERLAVAVHRIGRAREVLHGR